MTSKRIEGAGGLLWEGIDPRRSFLSSHRNFTATDRKASGINPLPQKTSRRRCLHEHRPAKAMLRTKAIPRNPNDRRPEAQCDATVVNNGESNIATGEMTGSASGTRAP